MKKEQKRKNEKNGKRVDKRRGGKEKKEKVENIDKKFRERHIGRYRKKG